MGSPPRREPHGDGVTVVVAGVTTWKARLGKPVVGPRATGEPLEPDAAARNAQRPKGEKRQLASRMLGKLARPVRQEGGWKRAARAAPRQPPILLGPSVHEIRSCRQDRFSLQSYFLVGVFHLK